MAGRAFYPDQTFADKVNRITTIFPHVIDIGIIGIRHKSDTILDHLGEEIAVSILAEIIAVRRGGKAADR